MELVKFILKKYKVLCIVCIVISFFYKVLHESNYRKRVVKTSKLYMVYIYTLLSFEYKIKQKNKMFSFVRFI